MRYTICLIVFFAPLVLTAQPTNNAIFYGGDGDGSNNKGFSTGINTIYHGGYGDGHTFKIYTQPHAEFRRGGEGDGWSIHNYEQHYVDFRKGGEGDGWNVKNFEQHYTDFRKGGEGDGWAIVFRPEGPLPVNILLFHAEKEGKSSLLKWTVSNEINVARYEVERSLDGIQFSPIGTVAATGLPNRQAYTFYDHHPHNGINYYRLKNIDSDSTYQYSNIAVLYFDHSDYIAIYPNPATTYLTISKGTNNPATFVLMDASGRIVKKQNLTTHTTDIDVSKLPGGIYRYFLYENITMKIRGSILIY